MKRADHLPACAARCREAGFSLIELMIAITLGMLIVAAVLALYLNISSTNNELAKANGQIENGRFAMQLLENDVVHAGYWGTYVPQYDDLTYSTAPLDAPTAVPDPCQAYATWDTTYKNNLIGIPVQAYNAASVCGTVITNKQANTDVLVVRHAETCVPGVGNCEADAAGKLYFQASLCEAQIAALPYKLDTAGFDRQKRDCLAANLADKRKFISNIYYIRSYAVTAGDGIPTLMRSTFDSGAFQPAQPLIEGIDGFRVELGIDSLSKTGTTLTQADYANPIVWLDSNTKTTATNRGNGSPDTYTYCGAGCTVAQLENAVVVKIYILARAKDPTPNYTDTKTYTLGDPALGGVATATLGPFGDNFKRHVFSTTVRLANISGRREQP